MISPFGYIQLGAVLGVRSKPCKVLWRACVSPREKRKSKVRPTHNLADKQARLMIIVACYRHALLSCGNDGCCCFSCTLMITIMGLLTWLIFYQLTCQNPPGWISPLFRCN